MKTRAPSRYGLPLTACLLLFASACRLVEDSRRSGTITPVTVTGVAISATDLPRATMTLVSPATHASTPALPALSLTPSTTPAVVLPTPPPPTEVPARAPLGGWLTFQSRRYDTNGDGAIDLQDGVHLYSLSLETDEVHQLTAGDHFDLQPAWSPDRDRIVFVSNRDGNYDLFIIDADGTNLEKLTVTEQREETPRWSPDGTMIAFVVADILSDGTESSQVHLFSVDDRQSWPLIPDGITHSFEPQWSPDGRFLLYTGQTGVVEDGETTYDYAIYLFEMATDTVHRLVSAQRRIDEPRWLPRAGYFLSYLQSPGEASSTSAKVFELQLNGGSFLLRPVFVLEDVSGGPYVWGPNGEWLIDVIENGSHEASVEAFFASLDLAFAPVDFASQRYPPVPTRSFYDESFHENSTLITNNTFYDDYPDWAP